MSSTGRITLATLQARKKAKQPISMLTAYDYPSAQIEDSAGVDCILVGDSAAQVILGHDSTLPISLDFLVTIAAAVRRGAPRCFLIGDMPFLSYQVNVEEGVRNAGRFLVEAGCDCVKIEGDRRFAKTVEAMSAASIPVMVHLGLRPQSVRQLGGYRAQARDAAGALRMIEDAKLLEKAGASAILLEAVPPEPARIIAESTDLPVIGCGAGPFCDGHVVVLHDMLGLTNGTTAKFVKRYADSRTGFAQAIASYVADIGSRTYPASEHCYEMSTGEAEKLRATAIGKP